MAVTFISTKRISHRLRLRGALVLFAFCYFAAPLGAQNADGTFYAIADRFFAEQWRAEPLQATRIGVHDYDGQLGDYSATAFAARIARAKRYLAETAAIAPSSLSLDARTDREILRAQLEVALLGELDAMQRWRHDPSFYTQVASGAAFTLIEREFAPLESRMRSVVARERAIPEILASGAANVTTVDPTTAQIARGNMQGAIGFYERSVPAVFARVQDSGLQAEFKTANAAVVAALREFALKMENGPLAHPSGTYAIGPRLFARRLELQELGPITLAEYERVGEGALEKTRADFVATARRIDPAKSPREVAEELGRDHPAADELLPRAQQDLDELRTFVRNRKLVTLPPDWDVKVVPTPDFERQTSFASMDSPGALEKVATQAYYRITTVDPTWSKQRQEQHLSFFNNPYRPIVSAHEVMPGHYLHSVYIRHSKLSLVRQVMRSSSFSEGWAHYDEQMIVDEGWGNGDPRVRLAMLQGALLRECRYLVGLREHTQGLSIDDATRFFVANAFLAEEPGRREALRGTQDPLYGYYTLGKLELLKLRADYQKKMGPAYSLQRFHDDLLSHGSPPFAVARKLLLGENDSGTLL